MFCLTGSPLRQVLNADIINNDDNKADVTLELRQASSDDSITIFREMQRKGSQKVIITEKHDGKENNVVLSSVDAYNKYIIDTIGITKDELLNSFILCKSRYSDFISSSDRTKKEIINKFSKANLIDEPIEHIKRDALEVQDKLNKSNELIANYNGRIEALNEQIEIEKQNSIDAEENKKREIKRLSEAIENNKSFMEEASRRIETHKESLKKINNTIDLLNDYEDKNYNGDDLNGIKAYLKPFCDYVINVDLDSYSQDSLNRQIKTSKNTVEKYEDEILQLKKQEDEYQKNIKEFSDKLANFDSSEYLSDKKDKEKQIYDVKLKLEELRNAVNDNLKRISKIEAVLSKSITCPHCHAKFVLSDSSIDINEAEKKKENLFQDNIKIEVVIKEQEDLLLVLREQVKEFDKKIEDNNIKMTNFENGIRQAKTKINNVQSSISLCNANIEHEKHCIELAKHNIESLIDNLMDDVFKGFERIADNWKQEINHVKQKYTNENAALFQNESSLENLKNMEQEDYLSSINKSIQEYNDKLEKEQIENDRINEDYNRLNVLVSNFMSFKTYLANSKVHSLAYITNGFLEAIKSDLRVKFEGYVTLKDGTTRDKIGISVLRDGCDTGSIYKLSVGEMSRIQMAVILAMNKLVNINADDNKGLNFLLIDEILDGVDESGLNNILNFINTLGITSMIISHGKIAESYPNTLTIKKSNGVSTINE